MKREQKVLKVDVKIEYPNGFYGYKYYVAFSPTHEILTNNKKFFNALKEGAVYEISFIKINKIVAPNTVSIVIDMKLPKVLREINN